MTELSLLIVNYNSWRLCVDALRSFAAHAPTRADGSPMSYEAIVVDNASPLRDPDAERQVEELCAQSGGQLVRHAENAGYSKGMNLAFQHSRGEWVLVSNPDVLFRPACVDRMLRRMERDETVGASAPAGFLDPDQDGHLPPNILPTLGDLCALTVADLVPAMARRYSRRRTRDAVRVWQAADHDAELAMLSGCCFLMRRALIDEIGLFDEQYPLYYEDTDLSVRIKRAGKSILQVGGAELVHLFDRSGQTNNEEKMRRYWTSRRRYYRKWYGRVGALLYAVTRRVLESKWGRRRAAICPHEEVIDLGRGHGKPVIRLDRPPGRLLVEFALDAKFFLAAGVFVDGVEWTPNDTMFAGFGPTVYWFRVVDLDDPSQPVIGIFKYEQLFPTIALPHSPEADERGVRRYAELQERAT